MATLTVACNLEDRQAGRDNVRRGAAGTQPGAYPYSTTNATYKHRSRKGWWRAAVMAYWTAAGATYRHAGLSGGVLWATHAPPT